jgi:hypothetical protein
MRRRSSSMTKPAAPDRSHRATGRSPRGRAGAPPARRRGARWGRPRAAVGSADVGVARALQPVDVDDHVADLHLAHRAGRGPRPAVGGVGPTFAGAAGHGVRRAPGRQERGEQQLGRRHQRAHAPASSPPSAAQASTRARARRLGRRRIAQVVGRHLDQQPAPAAPASTASGAPVGASTDQPTAARRPARAWPKLARTRGRAGAGGARRAAPRRSRGGRAPPRRSSARPGRARRARRRRRAGRRARGRGAGRPGGWRRSRRSRRRGRRGPPTDRGGPRPGALDPDAARRRARWRAGRRTPGSTRPRRSPATRPRPRARRDRRRPPSAAPRAEAPAASGLAGAPKVTTTSMPSPAGSASRPWASRRAPAARAPRRCRARPRAWRARTPAPPARSRDRVGALEADLEDPGGGCW